MRRMGSRHKPGSAHGPRGPQGLLGNPFGHPYCLLGLGTLFFGTFFLAHRGRYLPPRPGPKTMISDAQGGTRGGWGWKGAVQDPPVDPLDASHSRFGQARYLNSDPPS